MLRSACSGRDETMNAADNAPLETSLEQFLDHVQPQLKLLFARHRIPAQDTEDILQQTLLALVYQWNNVRDPEAWLFGTVRNKCRLYWRDRRRTLYEAVDAAVLEWLAAPQPPAQEKQSLWSDFETLVDRLPERCRNVLRMRYGLGYDPPEIADHLGYSRASISKVTTRCLAALTHQLVGDGLTRRTPRGRPSQPPPDEPLTRP
jgi:RNA polymerase sigma factor (sigma-70 family)